MKQYSLFQTAYYDTFSDFLDGISAFGEKTAVCTFDKSGNPTTHSFQQLCLDVSGLRKSLQQRGLADKRAVIAGSNTYEWIVAFLAVVSSGGVAICVDINQDNAAISENVRDADGDYAFTEPEYRDALDNSLRIRGESNIFLLHPQSTQECRNVHRLITEGNSIIGLEVQRSGHSGDETCVVMFTSGTTSVPKAVCLTQRNLLQNAAGAKNVFGLDSSLYVGVPLFHAYGLTCGMLLALLSGQTLIVSSEIRFIPRDAFLCGADTVFAVPLILDYIFKYAESQARKAGMRQLFEKMASMNAFRAKLYASFHRKQMEEIRNVCFHNIRYIVTGGAYMNNDLGRKLNNFGILVLPGYGITECSPLVSVNRRNFYDISTVGTVLPGYEVKFADGEILLRGPCVMKEYYRNPEATAEAIDKDGWFHTGDLGCFAPNGNLMIKGRIKNLIVFQNGNKVSPERIEAEMRRCPLVAEVCAYAAHFGMSKDEVGVAVSVYPNQEEIAGLQQFEVLSQLQKFVDELNSTMPTFQHIRIINIRQSPFEKTATGKIKGISE